jgi:hypothetical protein
MACVEFEPTTPLLERVKTVNTLDRAATVVGKWAVYKMITVSSALIFSWAFSVHYLGECKGAQLITDEIRIFFLRILIPVILV